MISLKSILSGLLILFFAACDKPVIIRALPFPTPAQHDLLVLTTKGPLTYMIDDSGKPGGLEHDLIEAFALELGVGVKYTVVPPAEIEPRMAAGEAHIATAWLNTPEGINQKATPPILQSHDILIQHEASLPISENDELQGKTIHALTGSRQLASLQALQKTIPGLQVVEVSEGDIFNLLESVGSQKIELAAMDSTLIDIATQFVPSLQTTLYLSENEPVVWWLGKKPNVELTARVSDFVEKAQRDGTLARIEERNFGHVRRLKQADISKFLGRTETMLPKLRKHFHTAQALSGLDWRLIAAVAYHESQWEPEATSPTGVRGIMMLTEETADRLQVGNRLDPSESILAGARYINMLKELLPDDVEEPDRTWLALAAYNIGPGHFNSARQLAKLLKADPNTWYDMKRVLPKLAQAKYAELVKSGRARGGEAVILVENIRSYYDILLRNAHPFAPTPSAAEGLKRLVLEVEERRKAYVKRIAAAKAITTVSSTDEPGAPVVRLPTIDQDTSPVRPAETGQVDSTPKS